MDTGTTCISTTWNRWSDATTTVGVRSGRMRGNFEVRVGNFWTIGRTRTVNDRTSTRRQKHFVVDWWADSDSDLPPRLLYIIIVEKYHLTCDMILYFVCHTADLALTPHAFNLIILLLYNATTELKLNAWSYRNTKHRIRKQIFDLVCQCGLLSVLRTRILTAR